MSRESQFGYGPACRPQQSKTGSRSEAFSLTAAPNARERGEDLPPAIVGTIFRAFSGEPMQRAKDIIGSKAAALPAPYVRLLAGKLVLVLRRP